MKRTALKRFKDINCTICAAECKSGKAGLCPSCHNQKAKAKREQAKKNKKIKDRAEGNVTLERLIQACHKAIKRIYPMICHGHETPIPLEHGVKTTQACHFVNSTYYAHKFDPRNILPGCSHCNFSDQSHTSRLRIWIDEYWGEGTAANLRETKQVPLKLSQPQKNALYNMFSDDSLDRQQTYDFYKRIIEGDTTEYHRSTKPQKAPKTATKKL